MQINAETYNSIKSKLNIGIKIYSLEENQMLRCTKLDTKTKEDRPNPPISRKIIFRKGNKKMHQFPANK